MSKAPKVTKPVAAPFALGHASGADWRKASRAATKQLGELPAGANLGFVYVTQEAGADLGAIVQNLKVETGIEHWVGAAGIGICATGREYFREPAVAVLAGTIPEGQFRVVDTAADTVLDWHKLKPSADPCFGIVHGDPGGAEILRLLPAFAAATDGFLVGGLTAPEIDKAQVAGKLTGGGLSGVLFAPEVAVATGLSQGCRPLGPTRRITECQRNVAIKIDNRPALDVFFEDIGPELAANLRRAAGRIFAGVPVEGSDKGDYMVRNITGIDPQRKLIGIGDMLEQGQSILFCERSAETAREDLADMLAGLKKRIGKARPRGAVYCSCVARGPHLFGAKDVELGMIAEALGDVPLVGFFGSGEISHNRLYTQTGVLSLFL